jgi:predicted transcriptional regulator
MLKEKIARHCDDHGMYAKNFSKLVDMAQGTYYARLKSNNWSVGELVRLKAILGLTDQEVLEIINNGAAD